MITHHESERSRSAIGGQDRNKASILVKEASDSEVEPNEQYEPNEIDEQDRGGPGRIEQLQEDNEEEMDMEEALQYMTKGGLGPYTGCVQQEAVGSQESGDTLKQKRQVQGRDCRPPCPANHDLT